MKETVQLNAIHDKDLMPLLREHQLETPLAQGMLRCHSCDRSITWDNIGGIAFKEGRMVLYCEDMGCLNVVRIPQDA